MSNDDLWDKAGRPGSIDNNESDTSQTLSQNNGLNIFQEGFDSIVKNEKQKMKKVDVWVTSPQTIANYAHNSRYVFAVCQCPVSFDKGIVIDTWQTKKIHGAYRFQCTECGLHGEIFA